MRLHQGSPRKAHFHPDKNFPGCSKKSKSRLSPVLDDEERNMTPSFQSRDPLRSALDDIAEVCLPSHNRSLKLYLAGTQRNMPTRRMPTLRAT